MKVVIVLSVLVAVAVARPEAPDGDCYDTKYDDFDIDTLISNSRLLKGYTRCFLGKGACTNEGAAFKKILPESIQTACRKCNAKQRKKTRIAIKAIMEKLPEEWKELVAAYDPEGKYKESFTKFLLASD